MTLHSAVQEQIITCVNDPQDQVTLSNFITSPNPGHIVLYNGEGKSTLVQLIRKYMPEVKVENLYWIESEMSLDDFLQTAVRTLQIRSPVQATKVFIHAHSKTDLV